MIDAAERLIAEEGLGAVSLREVATSAGQRNHSAVQYHFGSRAGLVEAVFDARMRPIDERRAVMLAELEASDHPDELWALCEVVVRPLGEAVLLGPPGWYGRFLAEVQRSEPGLLAVERPATASLDRAGILMVEHMDAVPVGLRPERLRLALVAAITLLADRERARPPEPDASDRAAAEAFVVLLTDLVHAMVGAAPSAALGTARRAPSTSS